MRRRAHALANGWKGEIEGVDLTLTFLRGKRGQTKRSISLEMPTTFREPSDTDKPPA